ncbi:D-altritol 5-dehydrogenase-like [Sycon ciliatum]|uniref:D-altritol 5-dehydrogenase-like n=1 Tax=Sycon ciliatum TaxID=27933 RepID=UPI0031F6E647
MATTSQEKSSGYCMLYHGTRDDVAELVCTKTQLPSALDDGEVLGKVLLATICGSDLHTLSGARQEAIPSVLGHEAVVEIVQTSNAQFTVGQRVTFSVADTCGSCRFCTGSLAQKCPSLKKYGHMQYTESDQLNGCYASHIHIKKGTALFPIPANLPDAVVAPANCALATMVNAVEKIPQQVQGMEAHPRTALVQGAGLLGVYGVALLKDRGFATVYCSDVHQGRLETVQKFGATPILSGAGNSSIEPGSVDAVIEVCGHKSVLQEGFRCLRPGGHYVLVGLVHPDSALPITAEDIIRKCATITGVHNYNYDHLGKAVKFLSDTASRYPYDLLVSKPYKLTELESAIEAAKTQAFHRIALQPCSLNIESHTSCTHISRL